MTNTPTRNPRSIAWWCLVVRVLQDIPDLPWFVIMNGMFFFCSNSDNMLKSDCGGSSIRLLSSAFCISVSCEISIIEVYLVGVGAGGGVGAGVGVGGNLLAVAVVVRVFGKVK